MASLSGIRTGLKNRLATISGLNVYDKAPGTVTTPAAIVLPMTPAIEFDQTMGRGADLLRFEVRLLIQRSTDTYAQEDLDAYLAGSGALSVKAAIEGDGTLGGQADWTHANTVINYGDIDHAGLSYLGARFAVEVNADGT